MIQSSASASSFRKPDAKVKVDDAPSSSDDGVRSVRFCNRVNVRKVRSHKRFTPKEKQALWYALEEHDEIRKECLETLRLMKKGRRWQDREGYTDRKSVV